MQRPSLGIRFFSTDEPAQPARLLQAGRLDTIETRQLQLGAFALVRLLLA